MRVTLSFFLLVFGSNIAFGQMQFLGFDHNYCPDAMSMNYTYTNWFNQLTEQGGYKIYRDGVEVFSGSATLPYTPTCVDLKFVNDGVGFMVLRTPLEHHRIYRTEDYGQTWQDVLSSNAAPYYAGMYVINDWTAYMVTYFFSDFQQLVFLSRGSTIPSNRKADFIYDTLEYTDIYKTDSLLNDDRCGADSLHFSFLYNGDTVNYHINFEVINANIFESKPADEPIFVYPNPASSYFSLQLPEGNVVKSMRLVSIAGLEVAAFDQQQMQNNAFFIGDLPPGMYVLQTQTLQRLYQSKISIE
jgi:hypothetical protein